ncbi:MAG TPA: GPW/gp25 family protein [Actinomycetes bacterium]
MAEEFIGRGWAFPVRTDATGGIAMVERVREIEEAIRLILGTAPGERPMRPDFGCGIHDQVFAPMDATTAGHIAHQVRRALERWEPRIDVQDVVVTLAPEEATIWIDVRFLISGSNSPRNLVFPFYVIGEEAAGSGLPGPLPVPTVPEGQ